MTDQTVSTYLFIAMIAIALIAVFLVLNGRRRAAEEWRRAADHAPAQIRSPHRQPALPEAVQPRRHGDYSPARSGGGASRVEAHRRSADADMDVLHGVHSPGLLDIADGYRRTSAYGSSSTSSDIGRDRNDTGHASSHGTFSASSQDSSDSYRRSGGSSYGGYSSYESSGSGSSGGSSDSGSSSYSSN